MTLAHPKHFTDREAALAAYDALWQGGTTQRVLNIEGLSGNGKSTLLWFIEEHHDKSGRPRLRLSLDNATLTGETHALLDRLADAWEWELPPGALDPYRAEASRWDEEERAMRRAAPITITQDASGGGRIENAPVSVSTEIRANAS